MGTLVHLGDPWGLRVGFGLSVELPPGTSDGLGCDHGPNEANGFDSKPSPC